MNLTMQETNDLTFQEEDYPYIIDKKVDFTDEIGKNNYAVFNANIPDGSMVLDVGCGEGCYGFLAQRGCRLYGIDKNAYAIQSAMADKGYISVETIDVSDECLLRESDLFKKRYDIIIFSDILEHLYDPASVLVSFEKCLQPDGVMLISIPNIAHIDVLLHLLRDEFNYSKIGLLDKTHIRFFTKNSFVKMIQKINVNYNISLECELIGETFANSEYCDDVAEKYPELWRLLNGDTTKNGLQLLFKVKRTSNGHEGSDKSKLNVKSDDAVIRLGEHLAGKTKMIGSPQLLPLEKKWYERRKEIDEQENGRLREQLKISSDEMQRHKDYIMELEAGIKARDESIKVMGKYIEQINKIMGWEGHYKNE